MPLAPVKPLPMTSDGTRLTCGNFPAPLLTEAANAEARLSDVLRNPWNNSVTLSDIADTEFSEIARAPVKTLPMTSEGTTFTDRKSTRLKSSHVAISYTVFCVIKKLLLTTNEIADERPF